MPAAHFGCEYPQLQRKDGRSWGPPVSPTVSPEESPHSFPTQKTQAEAVGFGLRDRRCLAFRVCLCLLTDSQMDSATALCGATAVSQAGFLFPACSISCPRWGGGSLGQRPGGGQGLQEKQGGCGELAGQEILERRWRWYVPGGC